MPRWFKRLGVQLALWNAATILLTGIIILLAVRTGVHHFLLNEADQMLADKQTAIERLVNDQSVSDEEFFAALKRDTLSHKQHPWFVQFFDNNDREYWASATRPNTLQTVRPIRPLRWRTLNGYRITSFSISSNRKPIALARIGFSLDSFDQDLAQVDNIASFCAVILAILAPVLGLVLSSRVLRPLQQMIQTADRLHPGDLTERIPLRGTGDELDLLGRKINDLLDRLASHLKNQRDFISNAAHEIRSPLAGIRSSVEIALAQSRTAVDYQEVLDDVRQRAEVLTAMVNQLLQLAEMESERLSIPDETSDLSEIACRCTEMFEALAEANGVTLTLESPGPTIVRGNSRRLMQVAINLVDNAIKFTPEGGRIEITVGSDAETHRAFLKVHDTGMGIPPEELPYLFDRFFRGRFARHAREGSGLGLSICQAIVRAYGGAISVESRIGLGTTFVVEIPWIESAMPEERGSSLHDSQIAQSLAGSSR